MNAIDSTELKAHLIADVLPLIEGAEFDEFVASIKANGLRHPIVLFEGAILDGRNRYRACRLAGIEPRFEEFIGGDPVAFVRDENLHRRNLNEGQRAMAMAEFANLERGISKANMTAKQSDGSNRTIVPFLTVDEAAAKANVSSGSIKRARVVLAEGTELEKKAVRSGTAGLATTAQNIVARRQTAKSASSSPKKRPGPKPGTAATGARLVVPAEYETASQWCHAGMALEANGMSGEQAALKIGMSLQSYRRVRDIVLLSERADLNKRDSEAAQNALSLLDDTRRLAKAHELIQPIAAKMWGGRERDRKTERRRRDAFDHAVAMVAELCERVSELPIPFLSQGDAEDARKQLRASQRLLQNLIARIKVGESQ